MFGNVFQPVCVFFQLVVFPNKWPLDYLKLMKYELLLLLCHIVVKM